MVAGSLIIPRPFEASLRYERDVSGNDGGCVYGSDASASEVASSAMAVKVASTSSDTAVMVASAASFTAVAVALASSPVIPSTSLMSKISVAFAGMRGGDPACP